MSTPILITTIGLLILLNSVFVCVEMALVSVPRARLKRYEKEKLPGARTAIGLQKDIDVFFATVQIGVTFIATLSSAIGGASAVDMFTPLLEKIGISPDSALGHIMAVLLVSVAIAYVSVVVGELAPKSLARRYPGKISLLLAKPFSIIANIFRPIVWFLTKSTRAFLRLFGFKADQKSASFTPEELRMMASELVESRQMTADIYDMLVRVTRLSQIRVEDIMIPRHKIVAIKAESKNDPLLRERLIKAFRKYHYTYYPVVDRRGENVLGVVNIKDLLFYDDTGKVSLLLRLPNFTARGRPLDKVLAEMQRLDEQLSVVVDEHGIIDGIVTMEDVLEELTGEARSGMAALTGDVKSASSDRILTVDGLITLHELQEQHRIILPHSHYYSTLAGFVLDKLGKIPSPGDYVDYENLRFEILSMDRNRIKELRIVPSASLENDAIKS